MISNTVIIIFICYIILCGTSCEMNSDLEKGIQMNHYQNASDNYNKNLLIKSLDGIYNWHLQNRTPLSGQANLYVPVNEIRKFFDGASCSPNMETQTLWSWGNGFKIEFPFIWYHNMLSFDQSKIERQELLDDPNIEWHENWIPIFSFEGEWYFVECSLIDDIANVASPVYFYFLEDSPRLAYTNLTKMMETFDTAFKRGIIKYRPSEIELKEDIMSLSALHSDFNKNLKFPYYVEQQ